jgi:hypothetical protein
MAKDYVERRRWSVAAAAAMGLREGDEVAVGGRAYAVTRMTDDGVEGEPTTESGYFVHGSPVQLDMRLPGWVRLSPRAAAAGAGRGDPSASPVLRLTLIRLVRLLYSGATSAEHETIADIVRTMRGVAVLPRSQLAEAMSRPAHERANLAVAAVVEPGGLTLVFADLSAAAVPLSIFQSSGYASPDFSRLALADCGNAVRLGEYEVDVGFVLRAARAEEGAGRIQAPSESETR